MNVKHKFGVGGIVALILLVALPAIGHAEDLQSPGLLVKHSPANPVFGDTVTYTATATEYENFLANIVLSVDSFTKTCTFTNQKTGTCTYAATYDTMGYHYYFATAADTVGNSVRDPPVLSKSVAVLPAPTGSSETVQIKSLFATPNLYVGENGCTSAALPLEVTGLVQEGSKGTNDGVLIYVENDLYDYVHADAANSGYFASKIDGICFDNAGTYAVTAKVERSGATVATATAVTNAVFPGTPGESGSGSEPGTVDIEAQPRILRTGAGTFNEILLSVENLGATKDTYELKVTGGEAASWLDLEKEKVTVNPGQTVYVSLFADIPSNANADSYPINIIAQGSSTDIDRAYIVVDNEDTSGFTGGSTAFTAPDYAVDVSVAPKTLSIDAGDSNQYIVTVQNVGKKVDTYDLSVNTNSKAVNWFTFKTPKVTLNPGEQKDILLYVDIPDSIGAKSYPVYVVADGNGVDIERASLTVIPRATFIDVTVGKLTVSDTKVSNDIGKTLAVSAPVSLIDISGESSGETVTARLYVSGRTVGTQNIFIPSGETKDVTFNFNTNGAPIYAKAGTYNIYVTADFEGEVDKSEVAGLEVAEAGAVKLIEVRPTDFNASANKNITIKLTVANNDVKDNTYTVTGDGTGDLAGKVIVYPSTMIVKAGETKTQEFAVEVGNVVDETYGITLKAASDKRSDSTLLSVNVKGGYVAPKDEKAFGAGLLIFSTGGTIAAIVGALLVAFILAYYYHTRGTIDIPLFRKLKALGGSNGDKAMAEALKKEVEKKPEAHGKPKGSLVWESMDFDRLKSFAEDKSGEWHPRDAENVLLNLQGIRDEFKNTVADAKNIKQKLLKGAEHSTGTISEKISYIKGAGKQTSHAAQKQTKKTGDSFVDKVVDSI